MRSMRMSNFSLEIYLVTDRELKKNVLAFPAAPNFPRPDLPQKPLGEIYLNPSRIAREKSRFAIGDLRFANKLDYLFIHGFLHLVGYDHKRKNDRIAMERKELKLLRDLKV